MEYQTPEDYLEHQVASYMHLVLSPILIVAGSVGNIVSFNVFYRKVRKSSKQSSYCYLAILAVFDTLSLILSALRGFIPTAFGVDIVFVGKCGYYLFFNYLCTDMSVYIIICMTVDRAISVFLPFKAKTYCTRNHAMISVAVVFLVMVCINLHILFVSKPLSRVVVEENSTNYVYYCAASEDDRQWLDFIWPWLDMSVLSFFPFVVLVILNGGILIRMARQTRRIHALGTSVPEARASTQRRTNILLFAICVMFLVTTAPLTILHIVEAYWSRDHPQAEAAHTLVCAIVFHLLYMNNCVNFVLYCWSGREFRNDLRKMCCGRGKQRDETVTALA